MTDNDDITHIRKQGKAAEEEITEVDDDEPTVDYVPPVVKKKQVSPLQNKWWLPLSKGGLFVIVSVLLIATILVWRQTRPHKPISRKSDHQIKPHSISSIKSLSFKPSALQFKARDGAVLDPLQLTRGQDVILEFYANPSQVLSGKPFQLTADIKIYTITGALLLYKRGYASYSDMLDLTSEKLLVETKMTLASNMTPGVYRVIIDITDPHSLRQASIQGRFSVK